MRLKGALNSQIPVKDLDWPLSLSPRERPELPWWTFQILCVPLPSEPGLDTVVLISLTKEARHDASEWNFYGEVNSKNKFSPFYESPYSSQKWSPGGKACPWSNWGNILYGEKEKSWILLSRYEVVFSEKNGFQTLRYWLEICKK